MREQFWSRYRRDSDKALANIIFALKFLCLNATLTGERKSERDGRNP